jgi:hypothetical protein
MKNLASVAGAKCKTSSAENAQGIEEGNLIGNWVILENYPIPIRSEKGGDADGRR